MIRQSMNAWARDVHIYCVANKVGLTASEAVALFGEPAQGPGLSTTATGGKLLQRATAKGRFVSRRARIDCPRSRGQWFVARYFAVGETPGLATARSAKERAAAKSYFGKALFANSIFDLAKKVNQ